MGLLGLLGLFKLELPGEFVGVLLPLMLQLQTEEQDGEDSGFTGTQDEITTPIIPIVTHTVKYGGPFNKPYRIPGRSRRSIFLNRYSELDSKASWIHYIRNY